MIKPKGFETHIDEERGDFTFVKAKGTMIH
jgi:hypothetical protein